MKTRYIASASAALFAAFTLAAAPADAAKPVNQAKFGTFEKAIKNGRPVAYSFWRPNDSKCTATVEKGAGVNNTSAVVFKGGSGSLIYYVKVAPGAKVNAKVKTCKAGNVTASLSIRYQTPAHKWILTTDSQRAIFSKDNEWTDIEVNGTVPANGGYIAVMLGGNTFADPNAKVSFDDLEIYVK